MTLNNQGETRNLVFVLKGISFSCFPGKMGSHLHLKDDGRGEGEVSVLSDKDNEWISLGTRWLPGKVKAGAGACFRHFLSVHPC